MALLKANVQATKATAAKKSDTPEITVAGTICTQYNEASKQMKDAEATMKQLRPDLLDTALDYIFTQRCAGRDESTVKVIDANGNVSRVAHTTKYGFADAEAADAVFTAFGADINEFAVETTKASFDNKFFLDENGNFDQGAFEAIQNAVAAAVTTLNAGRAVKKSNPLTSKLIVTAKPNFDEVRFKKFSVEQNKQISEVLPNTVSITPAK
jgi:hypothetical protein